MSNTADIRANSNGSEGHQRMPHRRTVIKGAAWSVPVIAAAVAAPAQAASGCTGTPIVRKITGTGASKGTLTFTLPANARCITFVIEGAGGQGPGTGSGLIGGSGARIEGELSTCSSARNITLVAGGGGTARVGGDGFGAGGDPVPQLNPPRADLSQISWGGGGGGGSAILVGATPVAVAGGGGGSGAQAFQTYTTSGVGTTWLSYSASNVAGKQSCGGVAPGGAGDSSGWNHPNGTWFLQGDGGAGAAGSTPGAGGGATWNLPTLDGGPGEVFGGNGTGPSSTGGAGGDGVWQSYQRTYAGKAMYVYTSGGGGGGGYAGGGGGGAAAASFRQPFAAGEEVHLLTAGGAGGAGSNFIGSASSSGCTTTATSTLQGSANNGGQGSNGGVGSVTISYYL